MFRTAAFFVSAAALAAAPVITSFTPSTVRYGGTVTITGSGFTGTTDVRVNNAAGSTTFVIDSDTQITAKVGLVPAQSGAISVINPNGTATSAAVFTIDAPAWSLKNPLPVASFIENVTYGAGLYVATTSGTPGLILTSADGVAWTVTSSTDAGLRAITYANGLFVATGDLGMILTSTDGLTWTPRTSGTTQPLYGIAFGAGKFVALGFGSTVLTSTDGATWAPQTLGTSAVDFRGEAFGAGLFAGVASGGKIFTSADGVTWTSQTSGTTNQLNEIIFANSKFLAVGDSGTIVNSTNGVSWTVRVPSPSTTNSLQTATFGNGKFVVAGFNVVMTSSDGNAWSLLGSVFDVDVRGITFGSGKFVAVGFPGQIYTSTDATAFTPRTAFTRRAFTSGVYGNGRYLLVGESGSVALSTNLDTWTIQSSVGNRSATLTNVAYGAGKYVAVGQSGALSSIDGVTWTSVQQFQLSGVVYDGTSFVATGNGVAVKSADAVTWTTLSTTGLNSTSDVTYGAGKYVAVGSGGKIYYSSDAVAWTAATTNTTNNLNSVTHGNGLFVAVGTASTLLTSPDGVTWTARTVPGANVTLSDVSAADGLFIVTSIFNSPNALIVSTDGTTWASVNLGANTLAQSGNYSGIAYGNGRFFLGTANGLIAAAQPLSDSLRITTQPASQSITANQDVTLTVVASGPAGLSYQWYAGVSGDTSSPIANATMASFSTGQLAASARYWVRVTTPLGATVDSAQADLLGAPAVVQQPPSTLSVADGTATNLSVQVLGPGPFNYQWQFNGVDLPGAVGQTYQIGSGPAASGAYRVVVSNAVGSITSNVSTVTITAAAPTVTLTTQPTGANVSASTDADFAVTATGTQPLSYQWQLNKTDITDASGKYSGTSSPTLRVKNVQAADAGSYRCVVTNSVGSATSSAGTLTVGDGGPTFTFHPSPASQTVSEGSAVFYSVGGKGTGPLSYQWQRDNVNIPGATDPDYNIDAVTAADAGSYTCVLTNSLGTITSTAAVLAVTPTKPIINVQPNQFISILGANATNSVVAIGTAPLTYQWKKNGVDIAGATGATLFLPNITAASSATYSVIVTNGLGSVESQPATLIIGNPTAVKSLLPKPHDGPLNGVAYGAGKFVAIGNSGEIRTSADGATWTSQTPLGNNGYESVIFANNQFVVVGAVQVFGTGISTGVILTSPDGTTWTMRAGTQQFPALRTVAFASSLYVAAGDNGTILTSADAVTWTSRTSGAPAEVSFQAVAFGAGKFVVAGNGGAVSSTDGVTWTKIDALTDDSSSFSALTFANGKFVIGTSDTGFGTSTDGVTWTRGSSNFSTEDDGSGAITQIIYAGGSFLAVTDSGMIGTSADGAQWVLRPVAGSIGLNDLVLGGTTYVVVGAAGEVLTSTDGLAWTSHRNSPLPATGFTGVACSPTMNVVVGVGGLIAASSDGVTWTRRTSNVTSDLNAVTYGGGRFVAVGVSGVIETSTDGLFWNTSFINGNPTFRGATFDGTKYIVVGDGGRIHYSSDAVTWLQVPQMPNVSFRAVAAGGAKVAAVGSNGVVYTASSSDLSAWTQRTSGTSVQLRSIAYGGGRFVAGGLDNGTSRSQFVTSTDGVTWTLTVAPYSSSINGLVYANGHFSSASGSSAVLSSTDGVVWTPEFSGTTNRQVAIAYGALGYISAGDAGSILGFAASFPPTVSAVAPATALSGSVVTITGSNFTGATAVSFNGVAATTFTVDSDSQITATIPLSATTGGVTVTSPGGTSLPSGGSTITVTPAVAPTISVQPASATVLPGAAVTFEITATGTPAPTYQWFKDTLSISGATTASYKISSVAPSDSGSYTCTVTNAVGSVTSSAAILGLKPAITAQPASAAVIEGTSVSFSVVAIGTAPLSYVWKKGTTVIVGATSATYSIPSVPLSAADTYSVDVSNAYGSVTSASATLSITALVTAPTITSHPVSLAVNPGGTATFSVEASGTAPFTYVWKNGSTVIPSATSATLTLTNVVATDAGSYTVTVTNSAGTASSNAATLAVNVPVSVGALTSRTVTVGDAVSFAVTAAGTAPFVYQWSKNGLALAGQNGPTLSFGSAATTDTGIYTCTVTNIAGSASASATLTVNPAVFPPTITSATTAAVATNAAFAYRIVATNTPASYAATGLPAGMSVNATTGVISGSSSAAGVYSVALSATNSGGTGAATLTLTVVQPVPTITSAKVGRGRIGEAFSYQITGTNTPTSFTASGLPPGLSLGSGGLISGTPTGAAAVTTVNITATNTSGTSATFQLSITIEPSLNAPVIIGVPTAYGRIGEPFSFRIGANNAPTSFASEPLPAGLTLDAATGTISGTPTGTPAATSVRISASNASGTGPSSVLTIIISPALTAPVITSSSSATVGIGTQFSYTVTATNNPTRFGMDASHLPAGFTFSEGTGVLEGTATAAAIAAVAPSGVVTTTMTATNSTGTGSASFTISFVPGAAAPVVTSSNTASGRVGDSFSYTVIASNSPTAFSATNLPGGLVLDSATGIISGTPNAAGTYSVLLSASNSTGSGGVSTLTLTIKPAAAAPVVTSAATAGGTAGVLFSYHITASNTPTSFNVTNLPPGFSFDALAGDITGTPSAATRSNIYVTASNAVGTSAPLAVLINIQPNALAPVVTSSQTLGGTQGVAITPYQITATNSPTSFAASGLPLGLGVDGAGLISGIPQITGTFTVTLTATNSAAASAGRALIVTIAPSPSAPSITSGTTVAAVAGSAFSGYTITATNSPNSFDASGRPAWLTVDTGSGALGGTPVVPGVYTVQLTATNGTGTSAPSPLEITVTPAVGSPVINSPLGISSRANDAFAYQIGATGAPLTSYGATGLPGGLSLNPTTGAITGTPTVPGVYQVAINAANAIGIGGAKTLVIEITAAPGSPVIGGTSSGSGVSSARSLRTANVVGALAALATIESSATVGEPYSFQISASGSPTSFSATGLPAGLAVNPGTGLISGAPAIAGVFEIEIRASNDVGIGASATLLLTVAPPATTPSITSAFSASGTAGVAFSYTATASNAPASYNATGLPPGLSLNAGTGVIGGTPTTPGVYAAKLSANNSVGTGASTTITITIAAATGAPAISSAATASGMVGAAFSYATTASHSPTSYGATGLPPGLAIDAATGAITGTPATDGEFVVALTARNAAGLSAPFKLTLTVLPPGTTPTITSPASASVTAGTTFAYLATATNSPSSFNITNLPAGLSANSTTGVIDGVPTLPGNYSIKISANNDYGAGATLTLALEVVPVGGTPGTPGGVGGSRLINLSSRGLVGTGDKVLITGFVITGSSAKPVMIRAVGPGLVPQGVKGELKDPTVELFQGSVSVGTNDNWGSAGNAATIAATATRVGAFALTNGSAEAVIVTTLQPGVYTAVVNGKNASTGVALVEVYDTSEALPASAPRLVNLSARGDVGTGDNVLIGGFVITGDTSRKLMLRAVGPALVPMGVSGALADPRLQVLRGGTVVGENDNWGSAGDAATIAQTATTVGAFALTNGSKDAVVLATLQPGAYTVLVTGVAGGTGVAMVEIYEVP